jgi:hypothetical protein
MLVLVLAIIRFVIWLITTGFRGPDVPKHHLHRRPDRADSVSTETLRRRVPNVM